MRLHTVASALPEHKYSADEIAGWTGASAEFIRDKVGIEQRAFLDAEESGVSLAVRAVDRLIEQTGICRTSIGLIIYVTQTPDHGIPHNAALLQREAGLPRSVAAFDMGLGCSGYPHALVAAKGFMAAQQIRRALIVTCDPYSKIMRRDDTNTAAVFGDAATATLVDRDGAGEIGLADFGTDGSGAESLILPAGRASCPLWSIHDSGPVLIAEADDYRLHMNGRAVFNFVMSEIPRSLGRALELNGIAMEEIRWFALHQGSLYLLQQLARAAEIPRQKLLVNLSHAGNTVSSTIPMLLEEQAAQPEGLNGPVLLSGFGVGLSWGSAIVTFH